MLKSKERARKKKKWRRKNTGKSKGAIRRSALAPADPMHGVAWEVQARGCFYVVCVVGQSFVCLSTIARCWNLSTHALNAQTRFTKHSVPAASASPPAALAVAAAPARPPNERSGID